MRLRATALLIVAGFACATVAQAAAALIDLRTVTLGPLPLAAWGRPRPFDQPAYVIDAPRTSPWARTGLGLFVTSGGQSMDPLRRDPWQPDIDAMPGKTAGGFGWRRGGLSAAIGYSEPDAAPNFALPARPRSQGLAGFTVTLHSR